MVSALRRSCHGRQVDRLGGGGGSSTGCRGGEVPRLRSPILQRAAAMPRASVRRSATRKGSLREIGRPRSSPACGPRHHCEVLIGATRSTSARARRSQKAMPRRITTRTGTCTFRPRPRLPVANAPPGAVRGSHQLPLGCSRRTSCRSAATALRHRRSASSTRRGLSRSNGRPSGCPSRSITVNPARSKSFASSCGR